MATIQVWSRSVKQAQQTQPKIKKKAIANEPRVSIEKEKVKTARFMSLRMRRVNANPREISLRRKKSSADKLAGNGAARKAGNDE